MILSENVIIPPDAPFFANWFFHNFLKVKSEIRKELRGRGFRNELFTSLEAVVDRLSETIRSLDNFTVSHITLRHWIRALFL